MATAKPGDTRLTLPNAWEPRAHQVAAWRHQQAGGLRAVWVWHRRAGKDSTALNWTAVAAHQRVGNYWHLLPEYAQARKAIWDAIDKEGRAVVPTTFPSDVVSRKVDDEMKLVMRCGSTWQVGGSDRYDALVGSNPVGVVFSEYSISNPSAWEYIRPILAENGGWAIFVYTPRGRNHGYKLFEMARKNKDWYAQLLTVNDTHLITPSAIQAERDAGMEDDMVDQEFFCSWEGVRSGSIFGAALQRARQQNRIGLFPYDKRYAVNTFWDIGHSDYTSIWFHQDTGGTDRFIHAYEASGQDTEHFVRYLKDRGYLYGKHHLPHDAKNVTVASKGHQHGDNVYDQLKRLGIAQDSIEVVPRTPDRWTAINATRLRLDTACFDEAGCEEGLNALLSYHKKWDDEKKCFSNDPVHDWSSNYADAIRQWAQGYSGRPSTGVFTFPTNISVPGGVLTRANPRILTVGNRRSGY